MSKGRFHFEKSNLIPLAAFLHNGLIRVGRRIGRGFVPYGQRYQVVVSSKHTLGSLVVLYFDEKNFHSGRELTLNLIRKKIWASNCKTFNTLNN